MMRLLALSLLVLAVTPTAQADDLKLSVKPLLCITDNRNTVCEMSFLVVWESGERGYYCLSTITAKRRCGAGAKKARAN